MVSYADASAAYVFGERLGDPVADTIFGALRQAQDGLSRDDLRNLFGRHRRSDEIGRALGHLLERGLVESVRVETAGRPRELWTLRR